MKQEWENSLWVLLSLGFLPLQSTSEMLLSLSSWSHGWWWRDPKQFHQGRSLVAHLEDWTWLGSEALIWCSGRAVPNSLPSDVIGAELMIQRGTGTRKSWVSSQPMPLTPHKSNSGGIFQTGASLGGGASPLRRRKIILSASTSLASPPGIARPGQQGCVLMAWLLWWVQAGSPQLQDDPSLVWTIFFFPDRRMDIIHSCPIRHFVLSLLCWVHISEENFSGLKLQHFSHIF